MIQRYRRWIGICCLYFTVVVAARGQPETTLLSGIVLDSLTQAPLQHANVYARDTLGYYPTAFALTDEAGRFSVTLATAGVYEITISYLGYRRRRFVWSVDQPEEKRNSTHYLSPTSALLDAVTVVETMPPVVYKEDTIIYNAEVFYTGRERKLRELLNNLPGVEVDRDHNIYVNGQRIDKVLVEGAPFFGGNSELAVKAIPADAVSKVEVIKAFRAVPFLSPSPGNTEDIINIKLRENKKELLFGDAALSSSFFRRYLGNTNLFYYSPKLNLYTTQATNNSRVDLLSIDQFVQLQGGVLSFVGPDGNLLQFDNSLLPSFVAPPHITEHRAQLSGAGVDYRMNDKFSVSSYFVYSNQRYAVRQESFSRIAVAGNTPIEERTTVQDRLRKMLLNANVKLEYRPRETEYLIGNIVLRRNRSLRNPTSDYVSNFGENTFTNRYAAAPDFAFAGVEYHNKLDDRTTLSTSLRYETTDLTEDRRWSSPTRVFLDSLFPWVAHPPFTLLYSEQSITHRWSGKTSYARQLGRYHALQLEMGGTAQRTPFQYGNWQQLDEDVLHPDAQEKAVDQIYTANTGFAGLSFRSKIKKTTLETGVIGDYRIWQIAGAAAMTRDRQLFLRPFVTTETDLIRVGKIRLAYAQSGRIPAYTELFTGTFIDNFNALRTGNPRLSATRSHNFDFSLQRHNLIRKNNFYLNARYSVTRNSVQDSIFNYGYGVERIPLNNGTAGLLRIRSQYTQRIGKFEVTFRTRLTDNRFRYLAAAREIPVQNSTLSAGFTVEQKTNRQNFVRFSYDRYRSDFRIAGESNLLHTDELTLLFAYRIFQDLLAELSGEYYYFSGIQQSDYHTVNFDLRYNRENSPLTITFSGYNLLDNRSVDSASLSTFTFNRRTSFTFPRTLLFGIGYQF